MHAVTERRHAVGRQHLRMPRVGISEAPLPVVRLIFLWIDLIQHGQPPESARSVYRDRDFITSARFASLIPLPTLRPLISLPVAVVDREPEPTESQ